MSVFSGLRLPQRRPDHNPAMEHVLVQRTLRRILAFTQRSIDDVVNDPVAKRQVLGFYKLSRQIDRRIEVGELERQWNSVA